MDERKKDLHIFNQQLKFSWTHIIAFIGLIATAYIVFMGFTYMTGGNFMLAGIGAGAIVLLLAIVFIGVQQFKATDHKFNRRIKIERVMLCLTLPAMALAMWPICHFWAVRANDESIVSNFTDAISSSRQVFTDYETYSNDRIERYHKQMSAIIGEKDSVNARYSQAGFSGNRDSIQLANMELALRLQLRPDKYRVIRDEALTWIENASQGASTWNIFLIGNTRQIKDAVAGWNNTLDEMSQKTLSNESAVSPHIATFADSSNALTTVNERIDAVTDSYRTARGGLVAALLFGLLLYAMLLFPYLIQGRNTRSMVTLFGRRKSNDPGVSVSTNAYDNYDYEADADPNTDMPRQTDHRQPATDDDDYQIF